MSWVAAAQAHLDRRVAVEPHDPVPRPFQVPCLVVGLDPSDGAALDLSVEGRARGLFHRRCHVNLPVALRPVRVSMRDPYNSLAKVSISRSICSRLSQGTICPLVWDRDDSCPWVQPLEPGRVGMGDDRALGAEEQQSRRLDFLPHRLERLEVEPCIALDHGDLVTGPEPAAALRDLFVGPGGVVLPGLFLAFAGARAVNAVDEPVEAHRIGPAPRARQRWVDRDHAGRASRKPRPGMGHDAGAERVTDEQWAFEPGVVDEGEHVFGVVPGPMGAGTNAFGQASPAHVEDVDVAGDLGEALCSESDAARRGRDPRDDDERASSSPS